jgi:HD-GYP domain-containing protein (c-di-GMP phosphodiesterase class II)
MRELQNLEESALMKRLAHATDLELRRLIADVQSAAVKSAHLLSTVVVDMPLYTLHNERHVLNVIGWMESLVGDKGIERLSALECAISILAAYTHDLGMTLSDEERVALPLDSDYLKFRDRYVESAT